MVPCPRLATRPRAAFGVARGSPRGRGGVVRPGHLPRDVADGLVARAILGGEVAQALGPRCSCSGQDGQVMLVPPPERGPDGLVAHVVGDGEVPQRLVLRALG